ncbi:unnamed protein product [Absidia cylindrospora]
MSSNVSKRNTYLPSPMSSPPRSVSPTTLLAQLDKDSLRSPALFDPILTPNDEFHTSNDYLSVKQSTLLVPSPSPVKRTSNNNNKKQPSAPLLAIISKYISDLEGRDKSIKIIQYAFKILLHYRWVDTKRWSTMVSHFSQTRKLLRVGHCVGTVHDMMDSYSSSSPQKRPLHFLATWCTFAITLGNEVADDLFCFYKMGVFGPSIGKKAEKVSIYCWFLGILIDLRSNLMSLNLLQKQQQQHNQTSSTDDHEAQFQKILLARVSCTKLMLDGIFCACDIWQPSFSSALQAWSGFFSGSLSGYKLLCKIRSS